MRVWYVGRKLLWILSKVLSLNSAYVCVITHWSKWRLWVQATELREWPVVQWTLRAVQGAWWCFPTRAGQCVQKYRRTAISSAAGLSQDLRSRTQSSDPQSQRRCSLWNPHPALIQWETVLVTCAVGCGSLYFIQCRLSINVINSFILFLMSLHYK